MSGTARARIERIEKALGGKTDLNPSHIKDVLAFFQSGDEAKIPEGVSFHEVQAAARAVRGKDTAKFPGLSRLRAALGDKCKGDILDYIAAKDPGQVDTRVIYDEAERNADDELFSRLGFHQICIFVVQTRPQACREVQP